MLHHHTKLTLKERQLIGSWDREGVSNKEIARRLHRDPATIGRELKRNRFSRDVYEPLHAERLAHDRQQFVWASKHPLKNPDVYQYVIDHLRAGWSPEQIAGRLKRNHPNDHHWQIGHETIYQFIYHPGQQHHHWWEYLRRGQKKRRKKNGRKVQRVRIPDRVSIHDRPPVVEQRQQFGHWEGDTLEGKGHRNGLHTAYERVSSLIRIEKMVAMTAEASIKAQRAIYEPLPKPARQTVTIDNGREHVRHTDLRAIAIATYFCDPYTAWQRGGVENANLWLRYYFPKGTDFATVSGQDLADVEWELNNRPRKRLNFQTPLEVFTDHLQQLRS